MARFNSLTMNRRTYLLLGTVTFAGVFLTLPIRRFLDKWSYYQLRRQAADLVETLPNRCPPDVAPPVWETATGWAITAYHNVCFSPGLVSRSELERFNSDLEQELAKEVDLNTIDWVWRRLEKTGPHGKRYVEKFEPQFRFHMAEQLKNPR